MTIDELKEIRHLDKDIKSAEKDIENIDKMYNTYRSPAFEKIGSSPLSPGDPTAEAVEKILLLRHNYSKTLIDLVDRWNRANEWLMSVNNSEVRAIIRHYYFRGESWRHASKEVYGYPDYYRARKAVMRWFKKEK